MKTLAPVIICLYSVFCWLGLPVSSFAQDDQGLLEILGNVSKKGRNNSGITVSLLNRTGQVGERITEKDGQFNFELQYTSDYTIKITCPGYADMFMEVNTSAMPEDKQNVYSFFVLPEIELYSEAETEKDISQFSKPFSKLIFDGKNGFKEDDKYREKFLRDFNREKPIVEAAPSERIIAGGLRMGDSGGEPLAEKEVRFLDAAGEEIETLLTDKNGGFVFSNLPPGEKFTMEVNIEKSKAGSVQLTLVNHMQNKVVSTKVESNNAKFYFNEESDNLLNLMTVQEEDLRADFEGKVFNGDKAKPVAGVTFLLTNNRGEVIYSSTDSTGLFRFVNILRSADFFFSSKVDDPRLKGIDNLQLRDVDGNIVKEGIKIDSEGAFQFKVLDEDKVKLARVYVQNQKKLSVAGNLFVKKGTEAPFAGQSVQLVDKGGRVTETAVTNPLGGFVFSKIPEKEAFSIVVSKEGAPAIGNGKLIMTNRDNQEIAVAKKVAQIHVFYFKEAAELVSMFVSKEEMQASLRGRLESTNNGKAMAGVKLILTDTKGKMYHGKTDENGLFVFLGVDATQNYSISAAADQQPLKEEPTIVIGNEKKTLKINIPLEENKSFNYQLRPKEQAALTLMEVEDPWLSLVPSDGEAKKEVVISENVYFPVNSSEILPETSRLLEKIAGIMKLHEEIKIELSAHTDSRGKDAYNLQLSEKRAQATRAYIISKGISADRVKAAGYGESKLLNKCANGVECSEQEHAKNRRVEFRVYY